MLCLFPLRFLVCWQAMMQFLVVVYILWQSRRGQKTKLKNKNNKSSCALPQVCSFPFIFQLLLLYSDTQFQTAVWPTLLLRERERERAITVAIKHAQELIWHVFRSVSDHFSAIVSGLCQSETVFELVAGFHPLRSSVVCVCCSFITSRCSRGRAPCSTWPWRLWSVQTKR